MMFVSLSWTDWTKLHKSASLSVLFDYKDAFSKTLKQHLERQAKY